MRRTYSKEFKIAACDLVIKDEIKPKVVAEKLGINNHMLYRWLGYTQFEKWLMNHDVLPIHGRMKHPQTQGKIERFHRTMKAELLNQRTFRDIEEADTELQKWRKKYNNDRPHEALGMKSPSEVYKASNREYEEEIKKYEYGGENHVIKVNSWAMSLS